MVVGIISAFSWVIMPLSLDHKFVHCFEQVLFPVGIFTRIGTFYLDLITSLVVFSVVCFFIASEHAPRSDLEVDGSTISHTHNA